MLDVCLPGTGGVIPLPERWLSCCWLEYGGKAILIDCGEGTQIALKKAGCKLSRLELLLITHYHADHIAGLPGLLLTLGNQGKTTPLTIIGPRGLEAVVSALSIIAPALPYPVELIEIKNDAEGYLEDDDVTIFYMPLAHSARCFGYKISLKRKPVFNPDKAERLGIPKPLFKTLHTGKPVTLEDGRIIDPAAVLDGEREPLSVCYITDSVYTNDMQRLADGASLLICEGMYGEEEMRQKTTEKGHMIFSDAARLANAAHVGKLWLTHFSPALKEPELYINEAKALYGNTDTGYDGIRMSL